VLRKRDGNDPRCSGHSAIRLPEVVCRQLRDAIKAHATRVAADDGIEVEYVKRPKNYRKEDRIGEILAERGTHPGLVHIFSVMELCSSYRPWHDKRTGLTHLRPDHGKCVYYYFYFIDEVLGLCFLSVPTWCPFRAQFCFNGHNWLASKLTAARVSFELQDNAIVAISNWRKAQDLSDSLAVTELHERGFRNRSLREHLGRFRSSQVSRLLKRLRLHGIVKKVGKTYK
jgi:hypothetical protein